MICICITIIIMSIGECLYLNTDNDAIYIWSYLTITILFSCVAVIATFSYLHNVTRGYAIWLLLSFFFVLGIAIIFGFNELESYIIIAITLIIRIYFVSVIWKYSNLISVAYETLQNESFKL